MSLCCRCEGADGERWHLPVSAMMKCGQKQDSCDSVSFSTDSFSCSLLFPLCRTEYLEVKITKKKNKNIIFFFWLHQIFSPSRVSGAGVSLWNSTVRVMTVSWSSVWGELQVHWKHWRLPYPTANPPPLCSEWHHNHYFQCWKIGSTTCKDYYITEDRICDRSKHRV